MGFGSVLCCFNKFVNRYITMSIEIASDLSEFFVAVNSLFATAIR